MKSKPPKPEGPLHKVLVSPFLRLMDKLSGRQVPAVRPKRDLKARGL